VLVLAQEEARLLSHDHIGTEHILLGLIHEGEGVAAQALARLGITLEAVRAKVEDVVSPENIPPSGSPPFTPRAKKVLELSLRETLQLGYNCIGPEHMLLGLVREGEGVAAKVLVSLGADLDRIRLRVVQLLAAAVGQMEVVGLDPSGRPLSEHKPSVRPPPGWVGGSVPWHVVLVRTHRHYVELTEVSAFPTGVEFTMRLLTAPGPPGVDAPRTIPGVLVGPRLDVRFADSRSTVAHSDPSYPYDEAPNNPLLVFIRGGGSPNDMRNQLWLWPLPPPGPLTLTVNWPEEGVVDHTIVLDATELVAAADRAERLWGPE
jgi:hypothetical protein